MPKAGGIGFVGWAIVPAAGFQPAFSTLIGGAAVARAAQKSGCSHDWLPYTTRMTTIIP
jgi:hypothetical protein